MHFCCNNTGIFQAHVQAYGKNPSRRVSLTFSHTEFQCLLSAAAGTCCWSTTVTPKQSVCRMFAHAVFERSRSLLKPLGHVNSPIRTHDIQISQHYSV